MIIDATNCLVFPNTNPFVYRIGDWTSVNGLTTTTKIKYNKGRVDGGSG